MLEVLLAATFLELTGPDGQALAVNRDEIVAVREPRSKEHFAPGTRCLIFTSDGKYLAVREPCSAVDDKMKH